jgi:hypothetical protein
MKNLFIHIISLLILLACSPYLVAQTVDTASEKLEIKKNKDGRNVSITKITAPEVNYLVELSSASRSEEKLRIIPTEDERELPFFSLALVDFDHDGFWDVAQTGACGNKVCEKKIYRFNPTTQKFFLFFSGAYADLTIFDKHLIEAGGSGCCAFEYHAYKIKNFQTPIDSSKSYLIISITAETDTSLPVCRFTKSDRQAAKVPGKKWLDFCEAFGEKYKLQSKR